MPDIACMHLHVKKYSDCDALPCWVDSTDSRAVVLSRLVWYFCKMGSVAIRTWRSRHQRQTPCGHLLRSLHL
jgi:hypothetical protein